MSANTPGPWQVFGVRQRLVNEDCQRVGPDGCAIAFLPIGRDLPGALADARLIAAAPELLAIVERFALATDEGDDKAQGTHYVAKDGIVRCKGSFLALLEDARAAIAKASKS